MNQEFLDSQEFIPNEVMLPEWKNSPEIFHSYQTQINKFLKIVSDLEITDEESCRKALNLSSDVKVILKDILALKKKNTEPYRQFINMMNEAAKFVTDKLDAIQGIITQKIISYESMLKEMQEMAQKSNKIDSEGYESGIYAITYNSQQIGSTAKTIVSYKKEKEFSVVNESLIPREYLKIDEDKIYQAIKLGITEIPGIHIVESKKLVLRRR
jgi:hypothetical protein